MAYLLPHLHSGWEVDQAIVTEEDRVVVIRFGRDQDATCMIQDEVLYRIAERVKNFAVIYVVDIDEVPDFNNMYELYDDCTTMFFYRNKHIMVDLGTGNNNKINWALADKQEMIDIIEVSVSAVWWFVVAETAVKIAVLILFLLWEDRGIVVYYIIVIKHYDVSNGFSYSCSFPWKPINDTTVVKLEQECNNYNCMIQLFDKKAVDGMHSFSLG